MDELNLSYLEGEVLDGAVKHFNAGQKADLFMHPSEQMAIDNFVRLQLTIVGNLQRECPEADKDRIEEDAWEMASNLDPSGYEALSKWSDMQEQFRLQK